MNDDGNAPSEMPLLHCVSAGNGIKPKIRASQGAINQKTCFSKFFWDKIKKFVHLKSIYQKTCISNFFGPNSKTCIVKVRAA